MPRNGLRGITFDFRIPRWNFGVPTSPLPHPRSMEPKERKFAARIVPIEETDALFAAIETIREKNTNRALNLARLARE